MDGGLAVEVDPWALNGDCRDDDDDDVEEQLESLSQFKASTKSGLLAY